MSFSLEEGGNFFPQQGAREVAIERMTRPLHVVIALILAILLAYLIILVSGNADGRQAATIALACLSVGGIIGFIFAIPKRTDVAIITSEGAAGLGRANSGETGNGAAERQARGLERSTYRANTSLEEISDWLTKIVIGLGLVEARQIGLFIQIQGAAIAPILFGAGASPLLGSAMLVGTCVLSFLASYLFFRLCLAEEFSKSDVSAMAASRRAEQDLNLAKEEGRAQAASPREALAAIVESAAAPAATLTPLPVPTEVPPDAAEGEAQTMVEGATPPEIPAQPPDPVFAREWAMQQAIERKLTLMREQPILPGDPAKGLFGGRSNVETLGRRTLSAKVKAVPGMEQWFRIDLKVTSGPPKLEGDVVFFLHPTFPQPFERAKVIRGQATVELYAYGAFTVGVLADDGSTELELDLGDLEDAPAKFRES